MGRDAAELTGLAAINVKEACDIVLETSKNTDPVEQVLKERFLGVVAEKGSVIPGAAYAIYLTSDLDSRQKLVSLLEGGEMPPVMPVEAMQFVLDQLPKPK
jgi:phosphotransferase system  glucose/maltose/N-acetylglucosamine-specific IIC component